MFDRGYIGKRGPKARTVVSPCGPQVERSPLIAFSHTPLPLPRGPPPYPPLLRHPARLPPPSRPSASTHTHTQRERERERERDAYRTTSPLLSLGPRFGSSSLTSLLLPFPRLLFRRVPRRASSSTCSFSPSTITRDFCLSCPNEPRFFASSAPSFPSRRSLVSLVPAPPLSLPFSLFLSLCLPISLFLSFSSSRSR